MFEGLVKMSFFDKWWLTDYALDIVDTLQEKEKQRIHFYFQSPQIHYRPHLVNWMRVIAEELKLCNTCVHVAVYVLDVFMDNHGIVVERLNLVTLVCLLLAAKFEERDMNIPKISDLNVLVESQYPSIDFISMEFMVMQFLKWSLVIPTAAHFAECYMAYATTFSDLQYTPQIQSHKHLQDLAQKCVKDLLDQTLQDQRLLHFRPSVVAASCIATARHLLHLPEMWTVTLTSVTKYKLHQLEGCIDLLLREVAFLTRSHKRELLGSPDHGYVTDNSMSSSPELSINKR